MGDASTFCADTANIWRTVGYFLLVFKIVIPIILIILGMIDLGKAVISSDDKVIKDSAIHFAKRLIAGVAIFFVPTIIRVVFNYIGEFTDTMRSDYMVCVNCLTNPDDCDTSYRGEIFPD